jgi:hypothetical protein
MSKLQDFLNSNIDCKVEEEIYVSDRFKDEKGKSLKFKVSSISEDENNEIQRKCTKHGKKGKIDFDTAKFKRLIAIEGTIDPCFKDAESLNKVGTTDPERYISKVLLPGEIAIISEKVLELSGFQDTEELKEEAKN